MRVCCTSVWIVYFKNGYKKVKIKCLEKLSYITEKARPTEEKKRNHMQPNR